jgi:hypothetical protein
MSIDEKQRAKLKSILISIVGLENMTVGSTRDIFNLNININPRSIDQNGAEKETKHYSDPGPDSLDGL